MKKNINYLNYIFFILLPFIDIITSITTRFTDYPISIGTVIKSIYLVILTIYILFCSHSKYKKGYLIYLLCSIIFSILYFVTKTDLLNFNYFFSELSSLIKFIYGSVLFFALIPIYDDFKYNKNHLNKILIYSLFTYIILLVVPTITHTNFSSYVIKKKVGSVGWFFAGNDVSLILVMLYPFIYMFLDKMVIKNNKKTYLFYLLLIPIIYAIYMLGTKASYIGVIVDTIIVLVIFLIKKKGLKNILPAFVTLVTLGLLIYFSPMVTNVNKEINKYNKSNNTKTTENTEKKKSTAKNTSYTYETTKVKYLSNVVFTKNNTMYDDIPNDCKTVKFSTVLKNKTIYKLLNLTLSGRENKAYTLSLVYKDAPIKNKLFGLGYTNTKRVNNCNIEKPIEIDFLDAFFHYGIVGLLLVLIPFIYAIKVFIKNFKKYKDADSLITILVLLLMLGLSCVSGHLIGYPSANIYLDIYLLLIVSKQFEK